MKIALVYDWLDSRGGVERMLASILEMFPQAPLYTSFSTDHARAQFPDTTVRTSFMQQLPQMILQSRLASFPFFPYAFEQFQFDEFDVVLSVSSSFAKGVITKPHTKHVSIVLTPNRYLWVLPEEYAKTGVVGAAQQWVSERARTWDFIAAQRPDLLLSISKLVQTRVRTFYNRSSQVIYPGLDFKYWEAVGNRSKKPQGTIPERYFLLVSRLEPYKKIEESIRAAKKVGVPIVIVGKGSLHESLQKYADETCVFTGPLTDEELAYLYTHAVGLIAVQEEDFGYIALESTFFGCPVVGFSRSGIAEIVSDTSRGIVIQSNTIDGIGDGLERCLRLPYNGRVEERLANRKKLERFSKGRFQKQLQTVIESCSFK